MTDRLPRDREKALEAIATGRYEGRRATQAHPLCVCDNRSTTRPETPPIHNLANCCDKCDDRAWQAWRDAERDWRKRPCPVH